MFDFLYSRPLWLAAVMILAAPWVRGILPVPKWLNTLCLCFCAAVILYFTLARSGGDDRTAILQPFYSFIMAKAQPEIYREMLMNVLLFLPLGLFLPYVFSGRNVGFAILTALAFSVMIESLQYVFAVGLSEMDDVICNTLGAVFGSLSYPISLLKGKISRKPQIM